MSVWPSVVPEIRRADPCEDLAGLVVEHDGRGLHDARSRSSVDGMAHLRFELRAASSTSSDVRNARLGRRFHRLRPTAATRVVKCGARNGRAPRRERATPRLACNVLARRERQADACARAQRLRASRTSGRDLRVVARRRVREPASMAACAMLSSTGRTEGERARRTNTTVPWPSSTRFRYCSMICCLLRCALESQRPEGLCELTAPAPLRGCSSRASCIVIVEAPETYAPARRLALHRASDSAAVDARDAPRSVVLDGDERVDQVGVDAAVGDPAAHRCRRLRGWTRSRMP